MMKMSRRFYLRFAEGTGRRPPSGQAMTEMVFLLPLLVILAAGCLIVAYMCWQGIQVQAAAGYAARIYGQERVGGALTQADIMQENGLLQANGQVGDDDPTAPGQNLQQRRSDSYRRAQPRSGVFASLYGSVRGFFTPRENQSLYIPGPEHGPGGVTDSVKVVRVFEFSSIFGWKPDKVAITGKGYGGEDSLMYGVPRWGRDSPSATGPLWKRSKQLKRTADDY
jgi:hypothetical protein